MTRPAATRPLRRLVPVAAAATAAGLLLAGCGSGRAATGAGGTHPSPPRTAPTTPTGSGGPPADRLVLRIDEVGGFVAPTVRLAALPAASLYADGRLLFGGPQTAQYPGRALAPVALRRLTAEQVTRLLADARRAGLDGRPHGYGPSHAADLPTTVFTVHDGGRTVRAVVPGLVSVPGGRGGTPGQQAARARLAAFRDEVLHLTVTPSGTVPPTGLAVFARPYPRAGGVQAGAPGVDPGGPPLGQRRAWPGPDPAAGDPVPAVGQQGLRCLVVRGRQLAGVLPAVEAATTITRWSSAGRDWSLAFRPMLPDESTCADVVGTLRPDPRR